MPKNTRLTRARNFKSNFLGLADHPNTVPLLLICGLIILGASGWYWWEYVYKSPHKVFWDMIDQNMATESVTRSMNQPSPQRDVTQVSTLQFTGGVKVHTQTELKQQGNVVKTESITTPNSGFVRYISIDETVPEGAPKQNFEQVEGVWSDMYGPDEPADKSQALMQSLFGPVMVGNLNYAQRRDLIKQLREGNAYIINFGETERKLDGGRAHHVYKVKLKPKGYVGAIANYFRSLGMNGDMFDPSQYSDEQMVDLEMTVDVHNRQLKKMKYIDSSEREESYKDYGRRTDIQTPKDFVSGEELQKRLQPPNPQG